MTNLKSVSPGSRNLDVWLSLAIFALVLLTYRGVWSHQFVLWDDDAYIADSARVFQGLTLDNLRWALSATAVSNWHPLTWWSYFLDASGWGNRAGGFALTNVVLHSLNSVLLFALLRSATGERWRSMIVAVLFALHPLHVESVAWISQRKDVLCGFFWLLTMAAYLRYARRGGLASYLLVTLMMGLAMMSKPTAIMLPVALVCMDIWPLGRVGAGSFAELLKALLRRLPEKMLWFGMAIALMAVTVSAQTTAIVGDYPPALRVMTVLNGYGSYLLKTIWPVDLHFYYLTEYIQSATGVALSGVALLVISWGAWRCRAGHPALLSGWLWFLLTLLPVIGIVKAGTQAYADRYHYLPSIGLFCMIVWAIPQDLPERLGGHWRKACFALGVVVLGVLVAISHRQVATWRDSESLFLHALGIEKNHYVALTGLAKLRQNQGRFAEAESLAAAAESLSGAPVVRGAALRVRGESAARQGDIRRAAALYSSALAVEPGNVENHFALGAVLFSAGDFAAAEVVYRQALAIVPDNGDAWINLGALLSRLGRYPEALEAHRRGMSLGRNDARAHLIEVQRLIDAGQRDEASRRVAWLSGNIPAGSADHAWLLRLTSALVPAR